MGMGTGTVWQNDERDHYFHINGRIETTNYPRVHGCDSDALNNDTTKNKHRNHAHTFETRCQKPSEVLARWSSAPKADR